jgi:hypothetical protein
MGAYYTDVDGKLLSSFSENITGTCTFVYKNNHQKA